MEFEEYNKGHGEGEMMGLEDWVRDVQQKLLKDRADTTRFSLVVVQLPPNT